MDAVVKEAARTESSTSSGGRPTSRRSSSSSTAGAREWPLSCSRRGLLDHRRALAGWCIGVIGYSRSIASIFPSIEGRPTSRSSSSSYPDALKSLFGIGQGGTSARAPVSSTPNCSASCCRCSCSCSRSARASTFAGEEDAGRLDLVLFYPVRRRDAVLARAPRSPAEVALLCIVGFVALPCSAAHRARSGSARASRPRSSGSQPSASSTAGSRSRSVPRSRARGLRSACRPATPRPPTSSAACTGSPAGWIRSASSRRSGSSAQRRCRRRRLVGRRSWSSLRRLLALAFGAVLVERRDLQTP